MPTPDAVLLLRHLRRRAASAADADSDRELLGRFAQGCDEDAFAVLLRRHGPMVLRVCRRVLAQDADAEDAFQATFLTLARNWRAIRSRHSVAGWLYGVALNTARKVRDAAARRSRHERAVPARASVDPLTEMTARQLLTALDEELSRLPEKYREPLVLCYLEGIAREDVAQRLGCPLGTLKGRLERGKEHLRAALARRGLSLSAALITALVGRDTVAATVPGLLARTTLRAAVLTTPAAAGFTVGKLAVAFFFTFGLAAAGVFLGDRRTENEQRPEQQTAPGAEARADGQQPKIDRYGDRLPRDALARLGTIRFRCWADRVAFLPGDKVLATVGQEAVSFWDVGTGKEKRRSVDMRWGLAHALSADGKILAVSAIPNDNTIHLWEVATGKHLLHLQGHQGPIHALAFAPDGRTLVSAGGGQVFVWDSVTGQKVCRAAARLADMAVAVSPDGKTFASCGWDVASAVSIREMATGKELHHYQLPLGVGQVVFAPDGKTLAAVEDWNDDGGVRDNKVHLWDVATGKLRRCLALREHISSAAFSPDSKTLATGHLNTFHVWDVATGKWLKRFEGHSGRIDLVAFSGDGKTLAAGGTSTLRLWDVATGKEIPSPGGHQGPVKRLAFLAGGKTLVTAGEDHTLRHWEAATGREIRRFPEPADMVFSPSFARGGKIGALVVGHKVRLCELTTGKKLRRLDFPDHVREVALSPDGKTLAVYTGGKDLTLRLVDTATGKERLARRYPDHVQVMAFSPGGELLALGPQDPLLRMLDVATGSEVYQLRLSENVTSLTFSPDGKTLAGGAGYGTLHFWEVATGKKRAQRPDRNLRSGSEMAFSPDGRVLALGDADGKLRLCLAATGQELRRLPGHRNGITCLAFAADAKTLASGSWDTTALVWDISRLLARKGAKAGELGTRQLEALWTELAADDAAKAYRAIHELAAASAQSVPFLARRVQPRASVSDERIAQLIGELDNERFPAREKATAELAGLERRAEPLLRTTLANGASPEVRRRIESLLNKLQGPVRSAETLRLLRTIEVLEHAATPEARQALHRLAEGDVEARLTREAKAALDRLERQ